MHIIWMIVFGAMMIYVAWWLIYSIRTRVVFEVFMALGVGSLWTAFFAPKLFSGSPTLVNWPLTVSLIGYGLFALSVGLVAAGVLHPAQVVASEAPGRRSHACRSLAQESPPPSRHPQSTLDARERTGASGGQPQGH